jgi:hypothetical protein
MGLDVCLWEHRICADHPLAPKHEAWQCWMCVVLEFAGGSAMAHTGMQLAWTVCAVHTTLQMGGMGVIMVVWRQLWGTLPRLYWLTHCFI